MNTPNILMILGALTWLVGEIDGVFVRKQANDTTSEFVWHTELKWPITRVVVGTFVVSLLFHLLFGTVLLP